jgi:hypothetical protein
MYGIMLHCTDDCHWFSGGDYILIVYAPALNKVIIIMFICYALDK